MHIYFILSIEFNAYLNYHIYKRWAKVLDEGVQVDTFILDFEKDFDKPVLNHLNVSCMAMILVGRL